MKERLIRLTKPVLMAGISLGIWVSYDIASAIFFGEYEYPEEK